MSIRHRCGKVQNRDVVKSKIELDLPFMVPDLVYKFQMIRFSGNQIGDKRKQGRTDRHR